jgi:DNA-binding transcriptional LysR family regulator
LGAVAVTLHQLELFVALAKCLSMTQLAREMHVSQSAISHQLKRLQRELGKTFFHSQGRGITLTDEGARFRRNAEIVLSGVDKIYRKYGAKTPSVKKK